MLHLGHTYNVDDLLFTQNSVLIRPFVFMFTGNLTAGPTS